MISTPSFLILLHAHIDPSTDKVWEVIKITTTNTVHNDDHFAKVKFSITPFNGSYDVDAYLDWEMTI
jgi:hypothetical protein